MTTATQSRDEKWAALGAELGVNATVAGPPITADEKSKLDVIYAELLQQDGEEAIVILRVKTLAGRVLEFDMALPWGAIVDATDEYDVVDGELVEHDFDLSKPEDVSRLFGEAV